MIKTDALIIGGGILGCFAARALRRWDVSCLLIEKEEDICTGITRANSAIVYAGYDNKVGSLKARMTVQANSAFELLCKELEVPYKRCGSLMVSFDEGADASIEKKYRRGLESGIKGLEMLSGREARELEPMLSDRVRMAMYCAVTGTVNPWRLGIAAYENALQNGCEAMLGTKLLSLSKDGNGYAAVTDRGEISCRVIINCAGLASDRVQEMLFPPRVRLFLDAADFLVLDRDSPCTKHVIFHETAAGEKGISAVPTTEGNMLLSSPARPIEGEKWASSPAGLEYLRKTAAEVLPGLELNDVIRSFAAVRPNPHSVVYKNGEYVPDGKSLHSFVIDEPAPGFYSLIGIKTPGLSCADELGSFLAQKAAGYLLAAPNPDFDPHRKAIEKSGGEIICRCEGISRAEVVEAIRRGAVSLDGVKRRVGTGMGRCQGSRCAIEIGKLLEEHRNGKI